MGSPSESAGSNAPSDSRDSGSDNNKPDKDSFDQAVEDNSQRPDRAPASTPDTAAAPDDEDDDNRPDDAGGSPDAPNTDTPTTTDAPEPEEEDDRGFFDRAGDFFGGIARDIQDFARENPRVDSHGNPVGLVDADGIQRGEVASRFMSSGTSSEDLAEQLGFSSPQAMAAAQNTGFIEDKYREEQLAEFVEALEDRYGRHPDLPSLLQTAGLLNYFTPEFLNDPNVGLKELSEMGLEFIAEGEMLVGVSHDLHHPTLGSGVTLGAGYDMGNRTQAEVEADLVAAGIDPAIAAALSQGAGLKGNEAAEFVNDNQGLVDLNREQQIGLAHNEMGDYVDAVQEAFSGYDLTQNQFDALVSFSYNLGAGVFNPDVNPQLAAAVESGDIGQVQNMMERFVYSGGQRVEGLVNRREAEIQLMNTPDAQ
jgi:hypothetical protein